MFKGGAVDGDQPPPPPAPTPPPPTDGSGSSSTVCTKPMRLNIRALAQNDGPPGWPEQSDTAGCDFVRDGRSMTPALTDHTTGPGAGTLVVPCLLSGVYNRIHPHTTSLHIDIKDLEIFSETVGHEKTQRNQETVRSGIFVLLREAVL